MNADIVVDEGVEFRFFQKVEKTEGCWLWTAGTYGQGYGKINIRRRTCAAHRVSFVMATGIQPRDLYVLHSCDNPRCVNPAHLSLGTFKDNMDDMKNKNRHLYGAKHKAAKLRDELIPVIRLRIRAGETLTKIARDFGVAIQQISLIKHGKSWIHVRETS